MEQEDTAFLVVPTYPGCFVPPWRQKSKAQLGGLGLRLSSSVLFCAPAPWVKLLPVRAGAAEQHLVFHAGWAVVSQTFPSSQKNLWPHRVAKCPAWHVAKPCPSQLTSWPKPQILEVQTWKSTSRVASGCDVPMAWRDA